MSSNGNGADAAEMQPFGAEVVANSGWHLRRSRLFAGVAEDVVARYAPAFALSTALAGDVLRGEPEPNVHVIRRGRVRIQLWIADDAALAVNLLGPGDAFGTEALVVKNAPGTFAHCIRETLLLSAPAKSLLPALDESARFARNVAESLAHTLGGFSLALHGVTHARCTERVFRTLERIAREHGIGVTDGTLLDVALALDDVATLADFSSEAVATAFFFLEREGRIRRDGLLITLLRDG
ncbi:MAG: Crp/Fnr family transcriptional regulator [Vulcanimicrobiaceae bacterium]